MSRGGVSSENRKPGVQQRGPEHKLLLSIPGLRLYYKDFGYMRALLHINIFGGFSVTGSTRGFINCLFKVHTRWNWNAVKV